MFGQHLTSPKEELQISGIRLSGNSTLIGMNLGASGDKVQQVIVNDSALAEFVVDGTTLFEKPERVAVPECAFIVLYSGTVIWNGCGSAYWPENMKVKRVGNSWQVTTNTFLVSTENDMTKGLSTTEKGIIVTVAVVVVVIVIAASWAFNKEKPPEHSLDWAEKIYQKHLAGVRPTEL